jgi:hypothetical protein
MTSSLSWGGDRGGPTVREKGAVCTRLPLRPSICRLAKVAGAKVPLTTMGRASVAAPSGTRPEAELPTGKPNPVRVIAPVKPLRRATLTVT